jgi:MFS family permease
METPPKRPAPDQPLFTPVFGAVLGIQFAYGITFSAYHLLASYLLAQRGDPPWVLGAAQGAFAVTGVVSAPFIGNLVDRWGRLNSLRAALLLGAASHAAFAFADSVSFILVLRALHGICFPAVFNSLATITVDGAPSSRRAEALGYFASAMMATNAVGPVVGESVAAHIGWFGAWFQVGAWALLALLLTVPLGRALIRLERSPLARHDESGLGPDIEYSGAPVASLALFLAPGMRATLLGGIAMGLGVGIAKNFFPALLLDLGNARTAGLFVAFTVGALFIRTAFGSLPDRLGARRASLIALSGYGVSLIFGALSPDALWLTLAMGAAGLSHGLAYPALSALVVSHVSRAGRGRATAYLTGCFNLGFGLGTAGLSPFAPALGYRLLIGIGAVAVFAAALRGIVTARSADRLARATLQ